MPGHLDLFLFGFTAMAVGSRHWYSAMDDISRGARDRVDCAERFTLAYILIIFGILSYISSCVLP